MPQPWANLSAKFQDVIDLLTAQNAKLDALQQTLEYGLLMQADAPAPRIPYLLQVRNALIAQDGDPTDLRAAIWGLAGPAPGTTLTQLYAKLDAIHAAFGFSAVTAPSLRQLLEQQLGGWETGMDYYNMVDQMNINLAGLLAAMGEPTGDATSTVLGRLIAIANATACACSALNPQPPVSGCDGTAYSSSGVVIDTYGATGDMSIATFTEAGALLISDNGKTLATGTADWSGWSVYVASTAPQFAYKTGITNRLPTKQWIDLSDYEDALSFAVEAGSSLVVTLCGPVESPCNVYGTGLTEDEDQNSVWYALIPGEVTYYGQTPFQWKAIDQWISNRSFRFLSGDMSYMSIETDIYGPYSDIALNTWYHISQTNMEWWSIRSWEGEFTIEICSSVQDGSIDIAGGGS